MCHYDHASGAWVEDRIDLQDELVLWAKNISRITQGDMAEHTYIMKGATICNKKDDNVLEEQLRPLLS